MTPLCPSEHHIWIGELSMQIAQILHLRVAPRATPGATPWATPKMMSYWACPTQTAARYTADGFTSSLAQGSGLTPNGTYGELGESGWEVLPNGKVGPSGVLGEIDGCTHQRPLPP